MKISSVRIYTSLMSPFGWAFLHELLQNKNLIVREVVVVDRRAMLTEKSTLRKEFKKENMENKYQHYHRCPSRQKKR